MIIYFLMWIYFMSTTAEGYNGSTSDESLPDSQHIWHSYVFNTGAGNREELYFSNVEHNGNFESVIGVKMWKSLQIESKSIIVGLGNDFLLTATTVEENNSFTHRQEVQGSAKALAVFQKWNAKIQGVESFIIVAIQSAKEYYQLMWYQIFDRKLKFLWSWQYPGHVTHMDVIKINHQSKLLVVNERNSTQKNSSAEIYNFQLNDDLDIWLFEKIILMATPTTVAVFEGGNNVFFCASFPSMETIHIFRYSQSSCLDTLENKHFVFHQKIFSVGLKSIMPFQVGSLWYLAVASSSSFIYYIKDNLLFQPLSPHSLGYFNSWLAIPVDTYREDTLLLAHSDSDVSVVAWTGDKDVKVIGSFTELACRGDVYCSEIMKRVALNESTAFTQNGHQNIIFSIQNGTPLLFKLFMKLKPLPDIAVLKLKEISNEQNFLEKNYTSQLEQISWLLSERENLSKIDSVIFLEKKSEATSAPEAVSQTKYQQTVSTELNGLKTTVESLNVDIQKFMDDLKQVFSEKDAQNSKTNLTGNAAEGITFLGNVVINELNLSSINGHPVSELLADSFRRDNAKKIGGIKTLKKLSVENVVFEKLGGISASDIVFSDDSCESNDKNIINGDIVWNNKLNILNDVNISREGTKQEPSAIKTPGRTLKPIYDALNFKELEVTEDFYVQNTINGQPIILPEHGGHLNILDIVSQARFEIVNVKQNLNVEIINGKNFTSLANKILRGTSLQEFNSLKVDGVFSAAAIEAETFNGIDLSTGLWDTEDSDAQKVNAKLRAIDPVAYGTENNLKIGRNENLKRIVHVFDNLEVEGILFSNKINNMSWMVMNDTVKKNEETVNLVGAKTFEKSLGSSKATLSGTLNGRFVEHIMTNFSNQNVPHPQVFKDVKFKNLSLEGAWDGTYVNQLNESIVRLSFSNGRESNLTFQNECFMNVLNVTKFVNDIDVSSKVLRPKSGKINLKSIKASHVVLHGSLITNNKINNMNLTNFNTVRVSLKHPETIDKDIYQYNVSISGDLNVETLNFNDVSPIISSGGDANLSENFMNGETHQIKKLLVKGNISTSHGINGFNLSRIFEKAMRITKRGSIGGNITFENMVYFDNINVTDSIDGFPLKQLEKDIAFKHSQVFLTGAKNISSLKVTKNIRARSLNGYLIDGVVTLKGDHTLKGPIHVNGNVTVRGHLMPYFAMNDTAITDLLQTYSTRFNSYIYSGNLHLSNEQVTVKNLLVGGKIQNVYLDALMSDAVRKDDGLKGLINVSGKKTFKGEVKFKENVEVEEFIHGVNLSTFFADVIFINKPTKLGGTVTVQESVLKELETTAHFNSTLINNIDTDDWLEDAIPLDRYEVVSGKKVFAEARSMQDVSVDFINGHLPSAMISLKKKQYIPTVALFPRIHTTSDLAVEGFVNGRNLAREFQDSVLLNGSQSLSGKTDFDGEFVVDGNLLVDTIKGKAVNSLVTLDTEQVITTPLQFTGLVTAKQNVENLKFVNNISLGDWSKKSVQLNKGQVLKGLWTVRGNVKTNNIKGEGLLHSVSLPNISKDIQKSRLRALELKNATEMEYSAQCLKVDDLSRQFAELPYLFDQFEMVHEIETPSVIDSVITLKIGKTENLIITFENECLSSLYHWNKDSTVFEYKRQINIGPVGKWLAIHRDEATYLVTSSPSSLVCEENLQRGNIWVFKGKAEGYTHLLTTEAFVDIAQENDKFDEFFTIDENGVLQRWTLQSGNVTLKPLLALGSDNYRFVDFRITEDLAVSNGREMKRIIRKEGNKVVERILPLSNSHILALPVDGKVLAGLVLKDKIVIYENLLEERIFSVIHTYKTGSLLWFNYGLKKQAFLIVASHHKLIEVYEYKGVSGLVKKMSIQMFSNKLQSVDLPVNKYQYDKFMIVIQKKKLGFARAEMHGDYFPKGDSFC